MSPAITARRILDPTLAAIREKVLSGQRLTVEDGVTLFRSRDIFTVGELANVVRERLHGRRAYYNINRHINYTNFCVLRCKFCSFYRTYSKPTETSANGADDHAATAVATLGSGLAAAHNEGPGYEYSLDQIFELAAEAQSAGATEVHIVGGLHPKLPFRFYTDMCRGIRERCPGLHIKAFTAIEIIHFSRIARPRMSIEEVLLALREAGLDSLPGGGAEIFDDRVHDEVFKNKVGEQGWFDVHRAAHKLGIPSNATMLYGHVETVEERVRHLVKLRELQDESLARMRNAVFGMRNGGTDAPAPATSALDGVGLAVNERGANSPVTASSVTSGGGPHSTFHIPHSAFQCLIPLSFIPDGSALAHLPGPTGLDDLRTLAVSRLILDNVPHIKAFWIMQTPKLSQVALNWGVDDFDGTVVWYDITKREGRGTNHQELSVEQIRRLIREAGCEPVERDTLYRPVTRDAQGRVVLRP